MTRRHPDVYMVMHGATRGRWDAAAERAERDEQALTKRRPGDDESASMGGGRAKYVTRAGGAPANDTGAIAVLTAEQISLLVADAVTDALSRRERGVLAAPRLLDRAELALALDCGAGLVDKLRRQGMPCVYLGDSPRFELEACLEWLRTRKAAAP